MLEQCNDTHKALKYILFNPGCTISEISASLAISYDYLIKIFKMITSDELHFVKLEYSHPRLDKTGDDVFTAVSRKTLISKVSWFINTENMRLIPLSIFDCSEKKLLISLAKTWDLVRSKDIITTNSEPQKEENNTVFIFDMPMNDVDNNDEVYNLLKTAIQGRNYIIIYFYGSDRSEYIKPVGFLRNDISGEWSLIYQDELRVYKTIVLENIRSVEIKPKKFPEGIPINIDVIRSELFRNTTEIELIIKNHPTAIQKLKSYLSDFGEFIQLENGDIHFVGRIQNAEDFKTFVLRLGSSVKVIKPEWMRDRIVFEVKNLIRIYEGNSV